MKKSRYNVFIEISSDETLVFNGVSKKFFNFSNKNIPELKMIFESPNCYIQQKEYGDFLLALKNNGFLVEDNVDELEQIRSGFESYKEEKNYSLMILTTYSCNFSCWYCVQKHKNVFLGTESIERTKNHISKYLLENQIKSFYISWFGGEPLINFDAIREICTFAQDFCEKHKIVYSCGITTNGSLITSNMALEMKKLGFGDFQITIDGIKDNHNKTRCNQSIQDSFTQILTNIKTLTEILPEADITVRINYTLKNLSEAIIEQIDSILFSSKENVELLFRKVWQEPYSSELSATLRNVLSKFKEKGYKIFHDYDNLKLVSCYVEKTHYHAVFPDGRIDKCTNKDMTETRGSLLKEGDIQWDKNPTENAFNVFHYPSECLDCLYLPLCMGPCPGNRNASIHNNKIHCLYENKDQIFINDIKNYVIINKD